MRNPFRCFTGSVHNGDYLQEIYSTAENGYGECDSVKWCTCCGAVVVDKEVDGRLMGRVVKMQFSEAAQIRNSLQIKETVV